MRFLGRLTLIFLVLAASLVLAAGAAILMRTQIAEGIIVNELAKRGANAELEIIRLSWNEISIEELNLEELHIARLELTYSIRELMNGQIRTANIDGLEASINLTGDGPPFGKLQNLLPQTADSDSPSTTAAPLPEITLGQAQLSVLLPDDEITLSAYGTLTPFENGSAATFNFETASGPILANGEMRAQLVGTTIAALTLETNLSNDTDAFEFNLQATSESPDLAHPELQFNLTGEGEIAALAWYVAQYAPVDDAQLPQSGAFQLNAQGHLIIPMSGDPILNSAEAEMIFAAALSEVNIPNSGGLPDWMPNGLNAETSGSLTLQQASLAGVFTSAIDYADRATTFELSVTESNAQIGENYALNRLDLNSFVLEMGGVPTPYGMISSARLEGSLTDLTASPMGSIEIHAASPELELATATVQEAIIDASVNLSSITEDDLNEANGNQSYGFDLVSPARFSLGALILPAIAPIEDVDGEILTARLELAMQDDVFAFAQTAEVSLPDLSVAIERPTGPAIEMQIETLPTNIESSGVIGGLVRFTTNTTISAGEFPQFGLLTQGAEFSSRGIVGGEINARLNGGSILHSVESPFFTTLTPDLQMVQNGDHVIFAGSLSGADGNLNVSVQGEHDLGQSEGNMRFGVDEIIFSPENATENSLSPLLASMEDLRGRANGEISFSWSAESFEQAGRIEADQMSFRRDGMTIEGLTTEVTLDSLLPARSRPGQLLTIRRIGTGIEDVTSLELHFSLDANEDGSPRITTESMRMDIAGGQITAEGGTFDPTSGESNIPLQAENIDLARMLMLIGLEELTAEGQLNGVIPFRIGLEGASIEGATLRAGAPGVVAYRSERAREALSSGGDAVILMLDVLEDFHYSSLGMTMSKPATGDTEVTLRMEGNNPAVLEGYPFDINITLTGDADPLLQALLAGQQISQDLLRSITDQ